METKNQKKLQTNDEWTARIANGAHHEHRVRLARSRIDRLPLAQCLRFTSDLRRRWQLGDYVSQNIANLNGLPKG